MAKTKFYFIVGILLILIGAYMIHVGLSMMCLGALALLCSYVEFEDQQ